jgi:hypothetical protein
VRFAVHFRLFHALRLALELAAAAAGLAMFQEVVHILAAAGHATLVQEYQLMERCMTEQILIKKTHILGLR